MSDELQQHTELITIPIKVKKDHSRTRKLTAKKKRRKLPRKQIRYFYDVSFAESCKYLKSVGNRFTDVYFPVKRKKIKMGKYFWAKIILIFICWIIFVIFMIREEQSKDNQANFPKKTDRLLNRKQEAA